MDAPITILIVEDGDEYLENLERFVPGPRYLQANGGAEALAVLAEQSVSLIYLDMRFDRVPREGLLGGDYGVLSVGDSGRAIGLSGFERVHGVLARAIGVVNLSLHAHASNRENDIVGA